MTQVLRVVGARKKYGSTEALAGADLQLNAGEWVALLGPNGAGKTTMIRSVVGRVRLDAGEIRIFDQVVKPGDRGALAKVGLVPQELALYPLLTARENLEVFGALLGVEASALKERVRWALDFVRLADRADEKIAGFSGGMKRRLNIACGVLHRPRIVLLDEPTVGVDPQSRHVIWDMLDTLRGEGASLLLTTHQLDEAQQVCDRIVIIDHGKVIADGTLDELIHRTVGRERRVVVRLDAPLAPGVAIDQMEMHDGEVHTRMEDVATGLPAMLRRVTEAGGQVADVRVEAPSLQGVFLHLTGKDLRE